MISCRPNSPMRSLMVKHIIIARVGDDDISFIVPEQSNNLPYRLGRITYLKVFLAKTVIGGAESLSGSFCLRIPSCLNVLTESLWTLDNPHFRRS